MTIFAVDYIFSALHQRLVDSVNQSHSHFVFIVQFFSHKKMREETTGSENPFRKLGEFKEFPVSQGNFPSEEAMKLSWTLKCILSINIKAYF